jgi:hypothetical protein
MSANNPFNQGGNKSGKGGGKPTPKGDASARRVQQEASGNRSGVGQRKGKPAPKPGVERSGGGSGSKPTPPGLPKNRPDTPKSGSRASGGTARRGCGLPVGIMALLVVAGVAIFNFI